ncbi:MAG: hypothetical protein MJ202_01810 [Lentisphaeria bacterium]|nr:hypothetical protein [Lentisphaeria bacterium]
MRLAPPWINHAVIQRNKPIVVWGWTDTPRTKVKITLGPISAYGASSWDGRFELHLPALPEGGPYDLRATSATGEECLLEDLMVGDVWLVSGQSNASFPLMTFNSDDPLDQTQQYLDEGGDTPLIRCYTVPQDCLAAVGNELPPGGEWQYSTPENAPYFTAIGAWFACFLHKKFPTLPIGILHSSWGGTPIRAWMSRAALMTTEDGEKEMLQTDQEVIKEKAWEGLQGDFQKVCPSSNSFTPNGYDNITERDRGNQGFAKGYANQDFDDGEWQDFRVPGSWIVQNISKQGALWARQSVEIPASWAGQPLLLHLGGVDKHDTTYFNGVQVGATGKDFEERYWNTPREYPVPAELVKAGKAVVAVRAFTFFFDGAFTGPAKNFFLKNTVTGEKIQLCETLWKACPEYTIKVTGAPSTQPATVCDIFAPHRLFDNMIQPLIPYGISGVLWYQGETDTNPALPQPAPHYLQRFAAMIRDWRYRWAQGDFPFYFVQLANYETIQQEDWIIIQDAQRRISLEVPNTGCITGNDLALFEPHDIHPHDKRSFGYRLFLEAAANTYGETETIPQGPTLEKISAEGAALRLHFRYAKGLHAKDGAELKGFEIAGADGVFQTAVARIDGDEVLLTAEAVSAPKACRYNADPRLVDLPVGNLVNAAELPALAAIEKLP